MNTMMEPIAFLIKQADVPALFGKMGLQSNKGSAFYQAEADAMADMDIETVYGELLTDADFLRAMRIIARPDLYVTIRETGVHGLSVARLHRNHTEGDWAVLTELAGEEDILLTAFPDYGAYLDAWAERSAGVNEAPAANYIPPTVSLEEFLFLLHAVDSFRRVSYQNMLDHIFVERAHITIPEFTGSMADSLKSMDIRWLLPAFLAVMPGIERYQTDLDAKHLEVLLTHDFFEQGKLASGEDVLVFGEAGQVMGVEFFHSWLVSWGFEINVAKPEAEGFQAVERLFATPTVLTNHLVRLEDTQDGKAVINHQAYTAEQMADKLYELFGTAFGMDASADSSAFQSVPAAPSPAQSAATFSAPSAPKSMANPAYAPEQMTAAPAPPAPKFCRNCGAKISAGAAFCANCGKKTG